MAERVYSKDDLVVVWKPELCIHSEKCVGALPKVFDPDRKPWIDLGAADAAAIRKAVVGCPSGALSLSAAAASAAPGSAIAVELSANGPLIVRGAHQLRPADGTVEAKSGVVAYCRCGGSARKPYCDGSHAKIGFKG